MKWNKKVLSISLGCIIGMTSLDVFAETTEQEFSAVSKIISLSRDVPAGEVEFGVVYDPNSEASKADMEAVKSIIGASYAAPKHTFKFKEIKSAEISSATAPILFLTEGLDTASQQAALNNKTNGKHITITTALPYVEAGNCVIGVDVGNSVKIIMHGDAYNSAGLKFDAAFEFMVKEI